MTPAAQSVLLVDDDEFVLGLVRRQLTALGFEKIVAVRDGAAALRAVGEQGPFGLVICDLLMPGMDGVEFISHAADALPGAALILMSAQEGKVLRLAEEIARTHGLHLLGSLVKPVAVDDLRRVIAVAGAGPRPARVSGPAIAADELRAAIAGGELDVYVQPKIHTADGSLAGVEALARWFKDGQVRASPDVFVPVAEASGLIDALTDHVLRRALQSCGEWKKQGLSTRIAINFSAATLHRQDLPQTILQIAAGFGVEPQQIVVEVTESGLLRPEGLSVLARLKLRGISLSIDDFGTGYSSLQQLRRLPISELKIDKTFVASLLTDSEAARIVESTLELARDLNVTTTAEGVETAAQLERLAAMGCDFAQGYHIARPFPRGELVAWARRGR